MKKTSWGLLLSILLLGGSAHAFRSETLRQLWDVPSGEVLAKTVRSYTMNRIKAEEIFYSSRPYKGKPVNIFGYFCYPAKFTGKLPAILLSHGGGGMASRPRAVAWAKRGYAVLAIDLPGKGEKRLGSRSGGPDMTVPILMRTKPDPSYNYLVHAAAAARNGITYLTQRKEVDINRIGMIGLSWGGVLTILTNGQDERLKAAVNVYGAGYIPEGCTWEDWFGAMSTPEITSWYNLIDPKNFLSTQHAPILFISGTNDHCYYFPTFQKSYFQVNAPKALILVPNGKHKFTEEYLQPSLAWLDHYLLGKAGFPKIALSNIAQKNNQVIISVQATAEAKLLGVVLHYSIGAPSLWTTRRWSGLKPYARQGNNYSFSLPIAKISPEVLFYVLVEGRSGGEAATPIRSIMKIKTAEGKTLVGISSPITESYRHGAKVELLGASREAGSFFHLPKKGAFYKLIRKGDRI